MSEIYGIFSDPIIIQKRIKQPEVSKLDLNIIKDNEMSLLKKKLRESFKEYPIELYDSNDNKIYHEDSNGFWYYQEFDSNNNIIYFENSDGEWCKREYDSNNNLIYFENSNGWYRNEFDSNSNRIYYEDSNGLIEDNRPNKEFTIKEIEDMLGIKNIKIIKG